MRKTGFSVPHTTVVPPLPKGKTKKSKRRSDGRRLLKIITAYKLLLFWSFVGMIGYSIFNTSIPILLKHFVDQVVDLSKTGNADKQTFFLIAGSITLVFAGRGLFYFVQSYFLNSLGQRLQFRLREMLFIKALHLPFSFYITNPTGDLTSRFTNDLNVIERAVYAAVTGPVRDVPQILFLIGLLFYTSPTLSLFCILIIPPYGILVSRFGKKNKRVTRVRQAKFAEMLNQLTEVITGIRIVKSFVNEQFEKRRFEKINEEVFFRHRATIMINAYSSPVIELISALAFSALFGFGAYQIVIGELSTGDFVQFVTAFIMITEPFKKINGFNLKRQEGLAAAQRIFYVLDQSNPMLEDLRERRPTEVKTGINIDIKSFGYRENTVLQNINISVGVGETVALVGSSGSGKTTLINLIPRFFDLAPKDGCITLDGVDIRELNLHALREHISVVTQDTVLFNDTVENNIRYGRLEASDEEVREAARLAMADLFIDTLVDGYQQIIGEKGVTLSGGQKQRLAIARAILKDAPILILDEATSALDSESEKHVQEALDNLMQNKTTIVIAHRFATIQNADIIHTLSDGSIIESGTHTELMAQGGEYSRLYDLQLLS